MTAKKYNNLHFHLGGIILILSFLVYYFLSQDNLFKQEDSAPVTIYIAGHISKAHQTVIDNFNREHYGKINVKTVNLSFDKFSTDEQKELFARFLRSESDRIDVFLVDQIWIPRVAKWSEPLEKYFSFQERQNLVTAGLEACIDGQHLAAVPLFIDVAMMYYREDLLKKYTDYTKVRESLDNSITWEDFIEMGLRLSKCGVPYYTFQAKAYEGLMCSFIELMASENMTLYKDQKLQLDTPGGRRALQLLVDLVNKYKLSPGQVLEFEENQSYEYFVKKDGMFLRGWPNLGWNFNADSSEQKKMSYIKQTLTPHFKGMKRSSILGGWNLMIPTFSKNKTQAIEFIKYCLSSESQKIMYEQAGFLPAVKSLYNNEYLKVHPELKFYKGLIAKGFHRPFLKNYTKISAIITNYVNQAISGKISVRDALRLAQEQINSDRLMKL